MIKNIHIFQSHTFQTLIQARKKIFAAAPVSVRAIPHFITGFCRNDQLITVNSQVFLKDLAKILLRTSRLRSIIIRQIKLCDPIIKCCKTKLLHIFEIRSIPKIMPQPQ